eukprot:CAMPEP_0176292860 /NCGR_PEP_ID=MMETSP0121_2-20121125/56300_1 /TAXON_ID=160619 /ORGANISM="Kryptoperidinium foliaceum, Strain CCMP 1326" /LENGTH=30 /DNA_ID= /DNA_START= /DNA_END= /DNA_ORIENTATION=
MEPNVASSMTNWKEINNEAKQCCAGPLTPR